MVRVCWYKWILGFCVIVCLVSLIVVFLLLCIIIVSVVSCSVLVLVLGLWVKFLSLVKVRLGCLRCS